MARGSRIAYPGGFYHVFNRGAGKQIIFLDDSYYHKFLSKLRQMARISDHCLFAYCLMPNHFHLIIQTNKVPLDRIMRGLATSFAMYFNIRTGHVGPVFQNRFKSVICEKEAYFWELSRYVHLNPVRGGLAKGPGDYYFSSFNEISGETDSDLIDEKAREMLVGVNGERIKDYIEFVEAGIREPQLLDGIAGIENSSPAAWGSNAFRTRADRKVFNRELKKTG